MDARDRLYGVIVHARPSLGQDVRKTPDGCYLVFYLATRVLQAN